MVDMSRGIEYRCKTEIITLATSWQNKAKKEKKKEEKKADEEEAFSNTVEGRFFETEIKENSNMNLIQLETLFFSESILIKCTCALVCVRAVKCVFARVQGVEASS